MANHHVGKLADVWKHLVLTEVLAATRPARYAETHAGSAAYPLPVDAERRYGVVGFLGSAASTPWSTTPYVRVVGDFVARTPALYPGSALQAMTLLGNGAEYLLCDLDPASVADLRTWARRRAMARCEVVERDGMAAVQAWLPGSGSTVVHVDPFDPFAHGEGAPSALDLSARVASAGHVLVHWYGYSTPADRAWAAEEIGSRTSAPLWWGDLLVTGREGDVREDGNLGAATTPGTGSGVVLANVPRALLARCEALLTALARTYDGRPLPGGEPGRLDVSAGTTPGRPVSSH